MPDNANTSNGLLATHLPLAERVDELLSSEGKDATDSVHAARAHVRDAQARLRRDLTHVSSASKDVALDMWSKAKPAVIVAAAVCGAIVVYRLLNKPHHNPAPRLARPRRDNAISPQIPAMIRSVVMSVAMAGLNRWLRSLAEPSVRKHDEATEDKEAHNGIGRNGDEALA